MTGVSLRLGGRGLPLLPDEHDADQNEGNDSSENEVQHMASYGGRGTELHDLPTKLLLSPLVVHTERSNPIFPFQLDFYIQMRKIDTGPTGRGQTGQIKRDSGLLENRKSETAGCARPLARQNPRCRVELPLSQNPARFSVGGRGFILR